jgi:hypothetical protein
MVIYTYTVPSLFFLSIINGLFILIEGIVQTLSLGMIKTSLDYKIFMIIVKKELVMRTQAEDKPREEWPRLQIWPKRKQLKVL